MTTSPIHNHYLSNQEDLGIVAVGFSGGQVRWTPSTKPVTRTGADE